MSLRNRQWVLRQRPQGLIQDGDLELIETPVPDLKDAEVLVRTIYLSLDPTNRTWMNDSEGYLPPVGLGEVMRGLTLGVVEASRSSRFKAGDVVMPTSGGWADYAVVPEGGLRPVHRAPGLPLTANMSVLGMTGLTAYFGVTDVLKAKEGETQTLTISPDNSTLKTNLNAFITAYNSIQSTLKSSSAYNADTGTAATLTGDAMVRGLQQQLRSSLSANVNDMKTMGLTIAADIARSHGGSLRLGDSARLGGLRADLTLMR